MFKILKSFMMTLLLGLTACSQTFSNPAPPTTLPVPEPPASGLAGLAETLPDLGLAPDFTNEVWINTDAPLTLEKLRGQVVLVEFWTYG